MQTPVSGHQRVPLPKQPQGFPLLFYNPSELSKQFCLKLTDIMVMIFLTLS
jgi:DNA mismatch repair protein MutH